MDVLQNTFWIMLSMCVNWNVNGYALATADDNQIDVLKSSLEGISNNGLRKNQLLLVT